jgi:ribosomal protein S18 acetylase RimI-like enzyme
MRPTFRRATRQDAPAIAGLFTRVRREALPYLPVLHTPEDDAAYFGGHVFDTCSVRVAETDRIVGFIAWRAGWVDHLYIDAGHRGQGIGGELLMLAMADQPALDLWAFQKNETAIAFYKRHGFQAVRETDGRENEENEPDVLMRWER